MAAPSSLARCQLSQTGFLRDLSLLCAHRGILQTQGRSISGGQTFFSARKAPLRKEPEKVEIPGLELVTYADRMHYVPGLNRPKPQKWERDFKDPRYYRSPPPTMMKLYKEKPCYVYNQRSNVLEGVPQAAWLTKTKVIPTLPPQLLSLAESSTDVIPNQEERVQNAIKQARFWDTTETRTPKERYSVTLLHNLLHLCASLQPSHPALSRRILAESYDLGATWTRGDELFQIRGRSGLIHCSMDPLPVISERSEVHSTADHVLETFYPVSPTIDLQKLYVYKENINCTGFLDGCLYPHAHTLYFFEVETQYRLRPEQFRAKMVMFAFGNALARAHKLHGTDPQPLLDRPITVQAVGTNGRIFQFMVFQLNTTDLSGDDGVKNQIWIDEDVELYDFAKVRPLIKKKVVQVPAGLAGYKPEVFRKFLALYLHGAV
ncbi:large ribosomal subunit protein mL37 [Gouania willdenowi]|uniref:Large ribosomal subunit protein mL37 n=1 Tax=Gouania willdenowi TaxID=441366 RepID=A0A8C5GC69_GOUWI|nr:39S ribosomal protein L37, mitochondrial [Gouania willdenowi]